jgi:hypothetical protein
MTGVACRAPCVEKSERCSGAPRLALKAQPSASRRRGGADQRRAWRRMLMRGGRRQQLAHWRRPMRILGKAAIVTGAASGIGAACAQALARAGAKVIAAAIAAAMGESVARKIAAGGREALFLDQDVTQEARWPQIIAAAEARFGRLDIMVAPIPASGLPSRSRRCRWPTGAASRVNLEGVFLSIRRAIPALRRRAVSRFRRRPLPDRNQVGDRRRSDGRANPAPRGRTARHDGRECLG